MNDADERYWIHSDFGKALVESLAHTADTVPLTMEIVAKTFTDIARLSEICSKPVGLLNVSTFSNFNGHALNLAIFIRLCYPYLKTIYWKSFFHQWQKFVKRK